MRKGSEYVELGEICTIKGGKRLPKDHELLEIETNHKYIRARDIKNGKINFDQPVYINEKTYRIISRYIVNQGDVIITIVGANIGDAAFVTDEFDGANLTENAVKLVSNKSIVDSLFLKYALVPDYMKYYFQTVASGAAQDKLGIYKIKRIKINLPPLKTQRKIASILSAYDDLIENNLKRIKLLEEQAQQTYEEWFVRMKFPGYETAVFDEDSGLPVGWEKVKIKDIGTVVTGKTPPTSKEGNYNGEIPFIKTPDMANFPYITETNQTLSELGAQTQKGKYLPKNSLIVSCIGSAGAYALVSKKAQTNQQINAIKFNNEKFTFYTYGFAKNLKDLLGALGSNGATMTNVNKGKFENIEIIKPENDLLNVFHNKVKNNFEVILSLQNQNQLLKEARDILLPRLMSGMIDPSASSGQVVESLEVNEQLGMISERENEHKKK
jgi:type I restriction enzyme S subunit